MISGFLGSGGLDHLYVCAPYFDEQAEALRVLAEQLRAKRIIVLLQSKRTSLTQGAAAYLDSEFTLNSATYYHQEKAADGSMRNRESLLHAKFFAAVRGNRVIVFAGSANCSRAALTIPGTTGNAELIGISILDEADFQTSFLGELAISETTPELRSDYEESEEVKPPKHYLRVQSAHHEADEVNVFYEKDSETSLTIVEFDGFRVEFGEWQSGVVVAPVDRPPSRVLLIGTCPGGEVRSSVLWIDNEAELRASSRGRSLVDSIYRRVQNDTWDIGSWTSVLAELHKHLDYMPDSVPFTRSLNNKKKSKHVEFTWDDVFSDNCRLSQHGLGLTPTLGQSTKIDAFRSMLLRWYGVHHWEENVPDET